MNLDQKPESAGNTFTCSFADYEAFRLINKSPLCNLDGCVTKMALDDETNININQENKIDFDIPTFSNGTVPRIVVLFRKTSQYLHFCTRMYGRIKLVENPYFHGVAKLWTLIWIKLYLGFTF